MAKIGINLLKKLNILPEKAGDSGLNILGIHSDVCNLGGHTRLFLMMMDIFKSMEHDVHIVARTRKISRAKVSVPTTTTKAKPLLLPTLVTAKTGPGHYRLKQMKDFQPVRFLHRNDVSLHDIPIVCWGPRFLTPWAPEVSEMIEEADRIFCDTEMYVRMETDLDIARKHIQFIHFPTPSVMPVYGKEPQIWANSTFTRSWIRIRWGYNNPNYARIGRKYTHLTIPNQVYNAEVMHPPLFVEDYENSVGFKDREYDVVMFSRLAGDKFSVAGFLDENFKLLTMGALSPTKQGAAGPMMEVTTQKQKLTRESSKPFKPKGEVRSTVSFKQVVQLLRRAKVYVHGKGFGVAPDTKTPSMPEHFGITICEAMASGCPAIVPRAGGCWTDISMQGKYTLGYSSLEELKRHVKLLVDDEKEWTKWHNLALERVRAFDVPRAKTRVKELLNY